MVTWEMLTGKRLFRRDNELDTLRAVVSAPIPRPSELRPGLPEALDEVVLRALARDPAQRYTTAQQIGHALLRIAASGVEVVPPSDLASWLAELFPGGLDRRQGLVDLALQVAAAEERLPLDTPRSEDSIPPRGSAVLEPEQQAARAVTARPPPPPEQAMESTPSHSSTPSQLSVPPPPRLSIPPRRSRRDQAVPGGLQRHSLSARWRGAPGLSRSGASPTRPRRPPRQLSTIALKSRSQRSPQRRLVSSQRARKSSPRPCLPLRWNAPHQGSRSSCPAPSPSRSTAPATASCCGYVRWSVDHRSRHERLVIFHDEGPWPPGLTARGPYQTLVSS